MGEEKETKEKLLESAGKEFLEKGYMKASLRKICSDAGVTTGALYFFFKDKEDLFAAIVEPPFEKLKEIMKRHFSMEAEVISVSDTYKHIDGSHDEFSAALIHHLYSNYDAFIMLLTKSQGSRFEGCVDEIVEMTDNVYIALAENMARKMPNKRVNSYMRHWLTHVIIDSFIHLITHEPDERKAVKNMSRIMNFFIRNWSEMMFIPKNDISP